MGRGKGPYRPSAARFAIMHYMLGEIYCDGYRQVTEGELRRLEVDSLPPHYRHNDIAGIITAFDPGACGDEDGGLVRGPFAESERTLPDGRTVKVMTSAVNRDVTRKVLEDLESKGILVRSARTNVRNRKLYYPNETDEGITALADYIGTFSGYAGGLRRTVSREEANVLSDMVRHSLGKNAVYEYSDPTVMTCDMLLNTHFCRVTVNRDLVLRRLMSLGKRLTLHLVGNGHEYHVTLPVRGRYLRTCEDLEPLRSFADDCRRLRDDISSLTNPEILLDLLNRDRAYADRSKVKKDAAGMKATALEYIDSVIDAIESEMSKLDDVRIRLDASDGDPSDAFGIDPEDDLRRESWGSRPTLDDDDIAAMRESAEVKAVGNAPLNDALREILVERAIEDYPMMLDDLVVLPTVCLLHLSPSAKIEFCHSGSGWGAGPKRIDPLNGDMGTMNQGLFLATVSDLMAYRCVLTKQTWRTRYVGQGPFSLYGKDVDTRMVFALNAGRYLAFVGGEQEPPLVEAAMGVNAPVYCRLPGLYTEIHGDWMYSEHLWDLVQKMTPETGRFLSDAYRAMEELHLMLKERVLSGKMPDRLRPHGAR